MRYSIKEDMEDEIGCIFAFFRQNKLRMTTIFAPHGCGKGMIQEELPTAASFQAFQTFFDGSTMPESEFKSEWAKGGDSFRVWSHRKIREHYQSLKMSLSFIDGRIQMWNAWLTSMDR